MRVKAAPGESHTSKHQLRMALPLVEDKPLQGLLASYYSKAGPAVVSQGNSKLGKTILHWSMPAISTCPGATEECMSLCYADEGFYNYTSVQESLRRNYLFSQTSDFVTWLVETVRRRTKITRRRPVNRYAAFRVHVSGDFYSAEYVCKWYEAISRLLEAGVKMPFFGYTRSWRVREIASSLLPMVEGLKGAFQLWYSLDAETGFPPSSLLRTGLIRTAYLLTASEAGPPGWADGRCDLYFRDERHVKRHGAKKSYRRESSDAGGKRRGLVCPHEQGLPLSRKVTCDGCRYCFR